MSVMSNIGLLRVIESTEIGVPMGGLRETHGRNFGGRGRDRARVRIRMSMIGRVGEKSGM